MLHVWMRKHLEAASMKHSQLSCPVCISRYSSGSVGGNYVRMEALHAHGVNPLFSDWK